MENPVMPCANLATECGHDKFSHGERGDCLVPGCLCASYRQFVNPIRPLPGDHPTLAPNKVVQKWVDPAMFQSEPLDATQGPKVYLLNMNTDPLGSIAAACKMYKGEVTRSLADVTDEERRYYLAELQKTKLTTPLEAVQLHFLIEGVTRSFTHQLVRQRTAAYAQESLRFAVVEDNFSERVALPPSLAGTVSYQEAVDRALDALGRTPTSDDELAAYIERFASDADRARWEWDEALARVQSAYEVLVGSYGIPAEDARGLLPHNITTRVHYVTNLRSLLDHSGNRLCTQAQFEWRLVFSRIAQAIRSYDPRKANAVRLNGEDPGKWEYPPRDAWQFEELAQLFKPVCYQIGKCAFEADFDRKCSIRDRVNAFEAAGVPSSDWHMHPATQQRKNDNPTSLINPAEWLLDPGAAR